MFRLLLCLGVILLCIVSIGPARSQTATLIPQLPYMNEEERDEAISRIVTTGDASCQILTDKGLRSQVQAVRYWAIKCLGQILASSNPSVDDNVGQAAMDLVSIIDNDSSASNRFEAVKALGGIQWTRVEIRSGLRRALADPSAKVRAAAKVSYRRQMVMKEDEDRKAAAAVTPEPSSFIALGSGAAALIVHLRRRRKSGC